MLKIVLTSLFTIIRIAHFVNCYLVKDFVVISTLTVATFSVTNLLQKFAMSEGSGPPLTMCSYVNLSLYVLRVDKHKARKTVLGYSSLRFLCKNILEEYLIALLESKMLKDVS